MQQPRELRQEPYQRKNPEPVQREQFPQHHNYEQHENRSQQSLSNQDKSQQFEVPSFQDIGIRPYASDNQGRSSQSQVNQDQFSFQDDQQNFYKSKLEEKLHLKRQELDEINQLVNTYKKRTIDMQDRDTQSLKGPQENDTHKVLHDSSSPGDKQKATLTFNPDKKDSRYVLQLGNSPEPSNSSPENPLTSGNLRSLQESSDNDPYNKNKVIRKSYEAWHLMSFGSP